MKPTTLYEFYAQKGEPLPSIEERGKLYEQYGLGTGYRGTAAQNIALLEKLTAPVSPPPLTPPPSPLPTPTAIPLPQMERTPRPPEAPALFDLSGIVSGVQKQYEDFRKTLEETYRKQMEEAAKKIAEARAKQEEYIKEQRAIYGKVEPLMMPYSEELEKGERERLRVEENYFANQRLTEELGGLLTELNNLATRGQELVRTGAISRTKYERDKNELLARTGIIESTMAARNKQIGTALNLIDRTAAAINADKERQLSYYNSLLQFYGGLRSEEGKRIELLTSEQKQYLKERIKLIENEMEQIRKRANYIKEKMIDPNTAQAFADAGITMLDDEETIGKKLADYSYAQEIRKTSEAMAKDDWTPLLPGQRAPAGAITTQTIDSRGNITTYYKTRKEEVEVREVGGYLYERDPLTGRWKRVAGTGLARKDEVKAEEPMTMWEIESFKRSYKWTPPYGFTKSQLLQYMRDNPMASPKELERGAREALARLYGVPMPEKKIDDKKLSLENLKDAIAQARDSGYSDDEIKTHIKSLYTPDELFELAKGTGFAKWYTGKTADINRMVNALLRQ